ncbi:hypothetical protein IEQ44_08655 [Nocardioides sp. Y6]|uniref:Uncharacterized protein n=1 Tax=Nocardioides malaquae TaxID=2773426 RepID=A0ABR9RU54_9ACTN|nr:hypothetical protein [Nocardioides malaquae]MBE7324722.1 hypothetical protein [Nocardioides malaquae]
MTVFLAWTSDVVTPEEVGRLEGPWREVRPVAPGLLLVESDETLSPVYHALKWSLTEGAALVVTPVLERPKLKGVAPGTTTWLRERTPKSLDPAD